MPQGDAGRSLGPASPRGDSRDESRDRGPSPRLRRGGASTRRRGARAAAEAGRRRKKRTRRSSGHRAAPGRHRGAAGRGDGGGARAHPRWQERTAGRAALDPAAESEDEDVPYDSDDDEKTRAAKEARTQKAREREFAAKILTPDALVAAEGEDAGVAPASRVPEEALDRMLLEDDEDDAERETSKNVAKRPMKKPPAMRPIERREMPPPRATTRVAVAFTKLETDHMPARAHREKEIREWKKAHGKKNARDPLDEDAAVNITEREPVFLKDKGDAFFRAGNYRSALEAYTAAVDAERDAPRPDGTLVRLYANRAACCSSARTRGGADCAAALPPRVRPVDADVGTRGPRGDPAQRLRLSARRAERAPPPSPPAAGATSRRRARLAPHDDARARRRDVPRRGARRAAARVGDVPRGGHRRRRGCLRRRHRHATARVPPEDRAAALANRAASSLAIGSRRRAGDDGSTRLLRDAGADAARARDAARHSTSKTSLPDASWALREAVASPGRRRRAFARTTTPPRITTPRRVRDDGTRRRRAPTRRGNRPSACARSERRTRRCQCHPRSVEARGPRWDVGWKRGMCGTRRRCRDEVDDDASRGRGRARGSNR